VQEAFLVQDLEVRGGDAPHTILILQHQSGRIRSAPFWASDAPRLAGIERGALLEVTGTITNYRQRRQLQVESLRLLPRDPGAWERLLPSIGDRDPWWALLDGWRAHLAAPRLAATLGLLFDDPAFRADFEHCPGSTMGHHARLGGLLQHTCEVAYLASAAATLQASADPDLLLAAALLHDIGKLDSYTWHGAFEMTPEGHAIGHVVLGVLRLDRVLERARPAVLREQERTLVHHLVLSHHGQLDYGAPVVPMTLEAEILAHADRLSARAASFTDALRDPEHFPAGNPVSSHPVWQLDRRRIWRSGSDWGRSEPTAG
jgi:3'-5' exoribonuclease